MSAIGSIPHLAGRFLGSVRATRPSPLQQAWVAAALDPAEAELFWDQPPMDQAHAVQVAQRVASASADPILVRAALLHDVGKRHSRTGVIARSLASGLSLAHLPTWGRWRAYLDHGRLGAADLTAVGTDPLAIAFAEHHHHECPPGIPADTWALLEGADGG
jgi:hypothetical protein